MTVSDLMEDRVMLDGVLMKCNQDKSKARTDANCLNARIAINRLASQQEPADEAKRNESFERTREQLRLAQERQRQAQQVKTKVDVYHLPLVPVEQPPSSTTESTPAPASAPTSAPTSAPASAPTAAPAPAPAPPGDASPPIVSQSNP